MRIYFHLKDSGQMLPDGQGIEVSGPDEARDHALQVINELREEQARYWSGWSLLVTDTAGRDLFTLDLGRSA